MRIIVLAISLAASALSNVPSAFAFTDKATGFSINPPANFVTKPSSHPRQDVAVIVNSKSGKPKGTNSDGSLCKVAYKTAPQNEKLTRDQINTFVSSPARAKLMRSAFGRVFMISNTVNFTHQGYKALEFHGTPKAGPNAANVRVFIAVIETRKGRASFICATSKEDFASGVKDFRAIRATMKVPG